MLEVIAKIYLYSKEKGGYGYGWYGMKPAININGDLIVSKIFNEDETKQIKCEMDEVVLMQIGYEEVVEIYKDVIKPNFKFFLNDGRQIIGEGIILESKIN